MSSHLRLLQTDRSAPRRERPLAPAERTLTPFVPVEPLLLTRRKGAALTSTGMTCHFFEVGEALELEVARLTAEEAEARRETALAWLRLGGLAALSLILAVATLWGLAG